MKGVVQSVMSRCSFSISTEKWKAARRRRRRRRWRWREEESPIASFCLEITKRGGGGGEEEEERKGRGR